HGIGELAVDAAVLLEVARPECRTDVRDMTERPQTFVGKSRVIAVFLFLGEPDAADPIKRMLRRYREAVVAVDGLTVGGAAAVRDPGAGARAHHRLERGHEAARRTLGPDAAVGGGVEVRPR